MTAKIELKTASGGKVILDPQDTAVDRTLVLPATAGTIQTSGATLTTSANLTFTGTGNRITGDFSNSTVSNRVMFQTNNVDGSTVVSAIPNGTAISAFYESLSSSSDLANTAYSRFGTFGTSTRIEAGIRGTGTYLPVTFYTGGSERVRIDTSGNVGIGTSSPDPGFGSTFTTLMVSNTTSSGGGVIRVQSTSVKNEFYAVESALTGNVGTRTNHPLVFTTNNTERARIDSSGNLLVGKTATTLTTDGVKLAAGNSNFSGTSTTVVDVNRNGTDGAAVGFSKAGVVVGSINLTASATSYATSSDYRLKESIAPMVGALAKNELLNPVTYKWKLNGEDGQGFIAHELQTVFPDAVTGEKDAVDAEGNPKYQGVDTSFLVGHLVACVKELKSELDSVKAELAAMKGSE